MQFPRRQACSLLVSLSAWQLCCWTAGAAARRDRPDALIEGIADNHAKILKAPGGLKIVYHLEVAQDRKKAPFLWDDGAKGEIKLLWPKLYNKLAGMDTYKHAFREREGEYDMERKIGAGRDGKFAQIAPYRHIWSAVHLFPLRFQFWDESDQMFVPGKPHRSDYWLPSALRGDDYTREADASVADVPCQVWTRTNGSDKLWVAAGHGFVVCRRELRNSATRAITERTTARNLKRLDSGGWLPLVQVQENYDQAGQAERPRSVVTCVIDEIKPGVADDKDMHIHIPTGAHVEDQLMGASYMKSSPDMGFATSLKHAKFLLANRKVSDSFGAVTWALLGGGALLFLSNVAWALQALFRARPMRA